MKVITPSEGIYKKAENEILVFLGGSCTDKNNWRTRVAKFLEKIEEDKVLSLDNLVLVNPFISKWNPNEEDLQKQIEWESAMIDQSDIYSCYLDNSSEAPITLFELGKALHLFKSKFANNRLNYRIITSAHPEYAKLNDIKFELAASTKDWKTPISEINIEKNISAHASKILESYMKFSK